MSPVSVGDIYSNGALILISDVVGRITNYGVLQFLMFDKALNSFEVYFFHARSCLGKLELIKSYYFL